MNRSGNFWPSGARSGSFNVYPAKYLRPKSQEALATPGIRGQRAATISPSLLFAVLILLMISITLDQSDEVRGFDPQLGVRVAAYSLAALTVLFALGRRTMEMNMSMFVWALVPMFITVTALYSVEPYFSLTAGLAHLVLLLFAWRMVNRHGPVHVVLVILLTGMIVGVLSIMTYYIFPDLGRSSAGGIGDDVGDRMRGVTAQPNSLGSIAAVTVLVSITYFQAFASRQRVLAGAAIAIGVFCLVYSDSRTSTAALLLCLLLWFVYRANAAFNLFAVTAIALAACLIITFVPDVSIYISRNGSGSDEIASLNGRSRIWAVAWEAIEANPIFGQGYGSSRVLLPNDDRLFGAAINTHNVYLELLFSGGAVLFSLFVVAAVVTIFRSAKHGHAAALIVLLFFLIRGATEAAPYAALPLFPAFVFYTAVSLCLTREIRARRLFRKVQVCREPGER